MVSVLSSTLTIQVRIPLQRTVFSVKFVFEKNENEPKRAVMAHFFIKVTLFQVLPRTKCCQRKQTKTSITILV